MTIFKTKMEIDEFIGYFLAALLSKRNNLPAQIREADKENLLSRDEVESLTETLYILSIVIFTNELSILAEKGKVNKYKRIADEEELSRLVSSDVTRMLGAVFADNRISQVEYEQIVENILLFIDQLFKEDKRTLDKGFDFAATYLVEKYTFGKHDSRDEAQRNKAYFCFHIAMQVCKNTQLALRQMNKDCKVV